MESTGSKELDTLLGGLRTGDNVVWHDESGSLAPDFFFSFMRSSFAEGTHVVYVSFDRSPKNLITTLGRLADNGLFTVLDCFTYGKGGGNELFLKYYENATPDTSYKVIPVKKPESPETLTDTLSTIYGMCGGKVNYIFESLTGIQDLWESEEKALKFYTRTCPKLYELNTIAYWVLEHKAHGKRLISGISQIAQVVMELSVKRGHNYLTIKKAEGRIQENLNHAHGYWINNGEAVFDRKRHRIGGKLDLGRRIKAYRTSRGLPQTALAKQVGVTPSTISQVESGLIYPSIPALLKISELLSVEMSSFFASEEGRDRIRYPDSEGVEVNIPGVTDNGIRVIELMPPNEGAGFQPYLVEFEPGAGCTTHFFHHKGEEFGFLLSGELELHCRDEAPREVACGTLLNLSSDMPSGWKNTTAGVARLLWVSMKK